MTIRFPSNTKDVIDDMRNAIGREITVFTTVSGVACPDCELDPTTGLSVDPFCETCDGNYWISAVSGIALLAHVRWSKSEQPLFSAGGIILEGDCKVTVTYSADNLETIQNSRYFIVDNKELYMKNFIPKGVPDINRITIILLEEKG